MSEVIDIAKQILNINNSLEIMRAEIKNRATRKSEAISNYDKALAITMIKLRNGIEMELDGQKVKDPQTTIMEKIAKGVCWKERLEMEKADSEYKSLITNIETVKAELNGLQSVNRHLE